MRGVAISGSAAWAASAEREGFDGVVVTETNNDPFLPLALAATSTRAVGLATGIALAFPRSPMEVAYTSWNLQDLTGGRFTLGLGRGIAPLFDAYGIPRITTAQLEDFVGLVGRLFRGEVVMGHDGPAGRFPVLHLDSSFDEDIPIGFVAFGPNSLAFAGRAVDMVVLHTFFTDETVERCVRSVREAAEGAGRDPASVRIWSCYATVHDGLPEPLRLKKTVGRLATYLQGYGDLLVATNGWDPAALAAFRADPTVQSIPGAIDSLADTDQLRAIAEVIPDEWLEPAATGSPERCAERVLRQLDLGCDGVILHGATPAELAPVVDAYRAIRPTGRFDHLDPNPGRT
jgi:5,10-methylenetetrahydromethanopterin reductase